MKLPTKEFRFDAIKRFLPASLFSRALLILVLPMLIVQTVAIYVFYMEHWESVERHFALTLAGDVGFITSEMKHTDDRHRVEKLASDLMNIEVSVLPPDPVIEHFPSKTDDAKFSPFVSQLRDTIDDPFLVRHSRGESKVILLVRLKDCVLQLKFPIKRLSSVSALVFILWMVGSAILLVMVATIFLRNQIRPIRKLAEVAEKFGRGQYDIEFRPQGASEVRQAGRSFLSMRERLKRMISARTDMLASISHDLRTPLTRMRLALAMLPEQKYVAPLLADVHDMEKMIQEYLDFARGRDGEPAKHVKASLLLGDVVGKYVAQKRNVALEIVSDVTVIVFYNAMCRCLYNVIDNALRYGTQCRITVQEVNRHGEICIDDNGPGIPEEQREIAMQPFKRLDASRNLDESGAGLGLSIVQDIVLRHGGELALETAPIGGLRVRISIPV